MKIASDLKEWYAISCPTTGLRFDARTLELLDANRDGNVRTEEVQAALAFLKEHGVEPEQLNQVLTDCGTVSLKDVNAAYPDAAATLALYRSTGLASLLPEAEKAARGGGFSAFERDCRGLLAGWMDRARLTPFGEDVLIRYLYRLEAKDA